MRSQGPALRGEVELVPTARTGGWQCLSGPDPLTAASLAWGPWEDGVGWVAGALGLSDAKSPSASAVAWRLAPRAGAEAGSELCFHPDTLAPPSIGSSGLGQVVRSSQAGRGTNVLNISNPKTRGLPRPPACRAGPRPHSRRVGAQGLPQASGRGHSLCPSELTVFGQNKTCRPLHSLVPTPYRSKHLLQPRPHPEGKRHTAWSPLRQESKPCAPTHVDACTHV